MALTSSLPTFHDFNIATREVKITSATSIINEATKKTYFLSRMLEGRDIKKLMKGGKKLVHHVQSGTGSTYGAYYPGEEESPTTTDNLVQLEVPWTFNRAWYAYDDEETELNDGNVERFVDLKKSYELSCAVDIMGGMEDQLLATPDKTLMEDRTAASRRFTPLSLLAMNTRDGLAPSSTNGGVVSGSGNWTTLQTVNPSTDTWFKNANATYTAAQLDDLDNGLVTSFKKATLRTAFEMPTAIRRYSDSVNQSMRKQMILTSEDGITTYESRLRGLNDRMRSLEDPSINGSQYQGVPIEYVSTLDDQGWTAGQPDYLLYNFNYIYPIFHSTLFMKEKAVDGGAKQPNRHVVYKFVVWQLFCESRRRQCRISAA